MTPPSSAASPICKTASLTFGMAYIIAEKTIANSTYTSITGITAILASVVFCRDWYVRPVARNSATSTQTTKLDSSKSVSTPTRTVNAIHMIPAINATSALRFIIYHRFPTIRAEFCILLEGCITCRTFIVQTLSTFVTEFLVFTYDSAACATMFWSL